MTRRPVGYRYDAGKLHETYLRKEYDVPEEELSDRAFRLLMQARRAMRRK